MSKCSSLGALSGAGALWAFALTQPSAEQRTTVITNLKTCMNNLLALKKESVGLRTRIANRLGLEALDKWLNICAKKFIAVCKGVLGGVPSGIDRAGRGFQQLVRTMKARPERTAGFSGLASRDSRHSSTLPH